MAAVVEAFHNVATLSAGATAAVGMYGSFHTWTVGPILGGLAFAGVFSFARSRAAGGGSSPLQVLLVLLLVAISFALHMIYLPAGLCCFVALLLCKNEVLLPPTRGSAPPERRPPKAAKAKAS